MEFIPQGHLQTFTFSSLVFKWAEGKMSPKTPKLQFICLHLGAEWAKARLAVTALEVVTNGPSSLDLKASCQSSVLTRWFFFCLLLHIPESLVSPQDRRRRWGFTATAEWDQQLM